MTVTVTVRRRVLPLVGLACVVTAGGVFAFTYLGAERRAQLGDALRHPSSFVDPGPLSRHHASVPDLAECESCHNLTSAPPDEKCMVCHEEIGRRRAASEGWHATFDGDCAGCHEDHEATGIVALDRVAFNHGQALFALRGRHSDASCESCHERPAQAGGIRMQWQGIEYDGCVTCHDDPHAPTLGEDCGRCHDERGWTGRALVFAHATDTSFALSGAHALLRCEQCHVPVEPGAALATAPLAGTPTACAACHDDPHRPTLGEGCSRCHQERGFSGRDLLFVHNRDSDFHLLGAHGEVACAECHPPEEPGGSLASAAFERTPHACAACHDDLHSPSLGDECTTCHGQQSWTGRALRFRHRVDTDFDLAGGHADVACRECHPAREDDARLAAAQLRGTPEQCDGCHEAPHVQPFPESCDTCHEPAGWTGGHVRVNHDEFPLRDAHAVVACARCHVPPAVTVSRPNTQLGSARFQGLAHDCVACHEDPHAGSLDPKPCADCHTERDFEQTNFDHSVDAEFRLDPTHARHSCNDCHDSLVFRPLGSDCGDCHAIQVADLAGATDLPADPHAADVGCGDCHELDRPGQEPVDLARACARCHSPTYSELHVTRLARVDSLLLRALNRPGASAAQKTETHRLRRIAQHNYVPAERALRELAGPAVPRER